MALFVSVTPEFAVAPQLRAEDFDTLAAAGFRAIVNNRPDGEAPGQLPSAAAQAAAEGAGLRYQHVPIAGGPSLADVEAFAAALASSAGAPLLAYCRSGMRSITVWALAQAKTGARRPEEIVTLARSAGYDLAHLAATLERLQAGSA